MTSDWWIIILILQNISKTLPIDLYETLWRNSRCVDEQGHSAVSSKFQNHYIPFINPFFSELAWRQKHT